ncbi:hypothetical protein Xcel_0516 [Xylanimonas cellulosilytica DSM 15894]|uniref:Uncharacterized protein n=1 Tax=Xylanimonas cellulosilytica (strain DSM 15894 / JCM 12276 / CECT 5975 / KCTC 9989 / LMG 20990 / NBRC 107835 / XIL07) TaxID=446471 RepID=D1BW52_XYLCX|nr:hypothetical protein [Xylanimonas cellulosilytica]ACZ29555.1 hypothetical protein Xcel_0516 [Xylanimonas cellulosilytica DSM 15894]
MTAVIPADITAAAQRGFIRTACQSLSSAIPTAAVAVSLSGDWALGVGLGVASAVVTAVLAGAASALSIVAKGIPEAYQAPPVDRPLTADERSIIRDLRLLEGRDPDSGAVPEP